MHEKLLTIDEAAAFLGVDYKTVYRLICAGDLPAAKVGRVYRISPGDLTDWFEASKARTTAEHRAAAGKASSPPRPVALRDLRCCITGKPIVSRLDIGGYAWNTGEPISMAAWRAGHRVSPNDPASEPSTP